MRELAEADCKSFLRSHRFGVMSLARAGEAYAVPLLYAFDGYDLFFHSRPGEKDDFLAQTTRGCFVVVDYRSDDEWVSVEARGPVHKVQTNVEAERGFKAIAENPFPPEFGSDVRGRPQRTGHLAYLWLMQPESVTGRASQAPPTGHVQR